ncbi:MAG: PAS domain S-box protein, partial [Ignavibacteriae bacterium]|nr:PAS domain S-box protein [Ignavibacteriota bacterium]
MANTKNKLQSPEKIHSPKNGIIRNSISNYQFVLNNLESGYAYQKIILDKKGKPVDFEYLEVNPAFEKLMSLKAEDIIGKRVTKIIPDFKKKEVDWIKFYGDVALTRKSKLFDFYSKSQKRWIHINTHCPKKGYFIAEFHDITERKQAEMSMLETHTQLKKTFENMTDGFVSLDKNWCYTYMNERAGEIFGRKPEDMIGKHIWTEFPEGVGQLFHLAYER